MLSGRYNYSSRLLKDFESDAVPLGLLARISSSFCVFAATERFSAAAAAPRCCSNS